MTSLDSEVVRTIDKFQWRELQYLKVQIADGIGFRGPLGHCGRIRGSSPSNIDFKVKKKKNTKGLIKKTMFIIMLNLADNQVAYIKGCIRPLKAQKVVSNIYETRSLSKHSLHLPQRLHV